MQPDDDVRLLHLREAAGTALRFAEGRTRSDLDDDEMLRLALTKLVEIVGEAAKQVSLEGRTEYPAVPWSVAARMRDRLVRRYEPSAAQRSHFPPPAALAAIQNDDSTRQDTPPLRVTLAMWCRSA